MKGPMPGIEPGPLEASPAVESWRERDRSAAVLPADREVIEASAALRALVLERAVARASDPSEDELFDACSLLGRGIAHGRGSASLASATIDHAAEALGAGAAEWIAPARAALAEGFVAETLEGARDDALGAWEYPRCAVPVGGSAIAIAASYPSDDPETVAGWAARVAKGAALAGIRRAFVAGAARAAVVDALGILGIAVMPPTPDQAEPGPATRGSRT